MLKKRIISSIIGLIILFLVVWSGQLLLGMAIFLISLIAMHEFYGSLNNAGFKPVKAIGYLSCIFVLLATFSGHLRTAAVYIGKLEAYDMLLFVIFILIVASLACLVFKNTSFNLADIALTIIGAIYVPFLFSFIVMTSSIDNGFYYIWLIFIGAWSTDTFAYAIGVNFGRHKLIPSVSPNKSVEGAIGGVLGCIAAITVYGYFIQDVTLQTPIHNYILLGLLCGIISQIGDLSASAIKRNVKIKDFGKIMPGHGGVLDRFDSILFIAPVVYFFLKFIII